MVFGGNLKGTKITYYCCGSSRSLIISKSNHYIFSQPHQLGATTPLNNITSHHQLGSLCSHKFVGHHLLEATTHNNSYPTSTKWSYHSLNTIFLATTSKEKLLLSCSSTTEWMPQPTQTLGVMLSFIFRLSSKENFTSQQQHVSPLCNINISNKKLCIQNNILTNAVATKIH